MTGWTYKEAVGKPINKIFHIIQAKTRELALNPVERVLEEGIIIGLANHTVLIAKDSSEYQIADSCAPIRAENGELLGAVLVFRDVTEEYAQKQALMESHERYNQLAAQSKTIAWEVDEKGLYTYISNVVLDVLGYEPQELVGSFIFMTFFLMRIKNCCLHRQKRE